MKKSNLLLNLLLAMTMIFAFTACEDDPVVEEKEGLPVADGFYITQNGIDPVATSKLTTETVEDAEFTAQPREGFYGGYVYLTAGDYVVVKVEDKALVESYGGVSTAATEETKVCTPLNYSFVASAVDGNAFAIDTEGLYKVTFDTMTGEIVYIQITTASIIGSATEIGWGDTKTIDMAGSVTAEGGSWTADNIVLREGEFKLRFNCAWFVDRRIDPSAGFGVDNGYMLHINFGGNPAQLVHGNDGSGIQVSAQGGAAPDDGKYTINVNWTALDGFTISLTRTGDNEPLPEFPESMYMIGDALNMDDSDANGTPDGWQWELTDAPMVPVHSNPHLFWKIVWLETGGSFKFAPLKEWNGDFGKAGDATDGVWAKGGDNVPAPATSGYYMVVVNLEEGAQTVELNEAKVYGIGDAFDIGDSKEWDTANPNNIFTIDNANKVIKFENLPDATDALRIHVSASTLTTVGGAEAVQWWQAELMVLDGNIEFRGKGDDQARVAVTGGETISLNFKEGTGTIN